MEYLEDFILYEKSGERWREQKKCVLEGKKSEERRIGVMWHTQGSGKSLTMLFYARKVLKMKEFENPLLPFITDRRNPDERLLSFMPIVKRAESIKELQELIKTQAGGIIFATIQNWREGGGISISYR